MLIFIIGAAGLLFSIFVLLSRIYIQVNLQYTQEIQHIMISVSLLGIRFFKKTYPIIPDKINFPASDTLFENFSAKLHDQLEAVSVGRQMLGLILQKVKLHYLTWKTEGGTGDAASTGTSAGGLWAVKGIITGMIANTVHMESKPVIQVTPHFQKLYFQSYLDCMVSIQIVQAIHIMFKIIRLFIFTKPKKTVSA